MADSRMDEARARLRDMALPMEAAQVVAQQCAAQTVRALQASFSEYAKTNDPYETGKAAAPPGTPDANDPTVKALADACIRLLNRRGLIRIDPA
jgi:hypothetical protein